MADVKVSRAGAYFRVESRSAPSRPTWCLLSPAAIEVLIFKDFAVPHLELCAQKIGVPRKVTDALLVFARKQERCSNSRKAIWSDG
jgi:hypothetical protein